MLLRGAILKVRSAGSRIKAPMEPQMKHDGFITMIRPDEDRQRKNEGYVSIALPVN